MGKNLKRFKVISEVISEEHMQDVKRSREALYVENTVAVLRHLKAEPRKGSPELRRRKSVLHRETVST